MAGKVSGGGTKTTRDAIPSGASAAEIADLIRSKAFSSVEVTKACLARIAALDPVYHAYTLVLPEQALAAAARADREVAAGGALGPLHGVPVNVKDAFRIRGTPTTLGSPLLSGVADTDGDAACVDRLVAAGAVILGKTNVGSDEWANPEIPRFEAPRNPWNTGYTAGGSSSGSAVSVSIGMGYASVGTDLGGSIRIPAAFTGLVGVKPTYGRVSLRGDIFGLCRTLEHVGPLTRTVRDAALMLGVLAGHDPQDPASIDVPVPDYVASLERRTPAGLRVGWTSDGGPYGSDAEILNRVADQAKVLVRAGADIAEVSLPHARTSLWFEATMLEEWEAHDTGEIGPGEYGAFIRTRLRGARRKVMGELAIQIRHLRDAYRDLFEHVDLLLMPAVPIPATPYGTRAMPWAGGDMALMDLQIANCWVFNATGHPAMVVPCGVTGDGLPIAAQLVARHFEECTLLGAAAILEEAQGGPALPPSAA